MSQKERDAKIIGGAIFAGKNGTSHKTAINEK